MITDSTPWFKLDDHIDAATAKEWAAINMLLAEMAPSQAEHLQEVIGHLLMSATLAAFRAGWNAHADPAPWILGCLETERGQS